VSNDLIQDRPVIMLGPDAGSLTDYSCAFQTFQINERRNTVVKAPTPSTSGLWAELFTAMGTRTAELYFEYTPADDTVSASNPKRTGYIVVNDLDTGAPAFEARRQSKTFPARDVSAPITS